MAIERVTEFTSLLLATASLGLKSVAKNAVLFVRHALAGLAARMAGQSMPVRMTIYGVGITVIAAVIVTVCRGEIDIGKLTGGLAGPAGRPVLIVKGNKLVNSGTAAAYNVEVTRPRYKLLGTIEAGQKVPLPGPEFTVRYEWRDGQNTRSVDKPFKLGGLDRLAADARVPLGSHASQSELEDFEPDQLSEAQTAPEGITAYYDPTMRILYVTAKRDVEIRVDNYQLRPVSRSDKTGTDYRYVASNILVLGQDLKQGQSVEFEVVFTKPQDFYSIPLYVKERGKPPVYFTVTVASRIPDSQL